MVRRNTAGPVNEARKLIGSTILYRPPTHSDSPIKSSPIRCIVRNAAQRYGHITLHVETPDKTLVWVRKWEVAS